MPVTVHETAFVVVQVIFALLPEGTRRGDALMEPVTAGLMQVLEPDEQNCGETQAVLVTGVVQFDVMVVLAIVWLSVHVQAVEGVHETVRAAPTPPDPVPVHCAVPPAPVHDAVYVVDCEGETEVLPEVAPPVEKLVPVHDVAFAEDQVSVDGFPCVTDVGFRESVHMGPTSHVLYA